MFEMLITKWSRGWKTLLAKYLVLGPQDSLLAQPPIALSPPRVYLLNLATATAFRILDFGDLAKFRYRLGFLPV